MPILNRSAPLGALLTLALAFTLTLAACDAADPAAPSTATLPTASAAAKSDVCHYDADADTYTLINVADRAIDAHIAHGDARPGEPVPTDASSVFDEACVPQLVVPDLPACYAIAIAGLEEIVDVDLEQNVPWTLILETETELQILGSAGLTLTALDSSQEVECVADRGRVGGIIFSVFTFASIDEREAIRSYLRYLLSLVGS